MHGTQTEAGSTFLSAGYHNLEAQYYQGGGGQFVAPTLPSGADDTASQVPELDPGQIAAPLALMGSILLMLADGRCRKIVT